MFKNFIIIQINNAPQCSSGDYGITTPGSPNHAGAFFTWINRIELSNCASTISSLTGYFTDTDGASDRIKLVVYTDVGDGSEPSQLLFESPGINGAQEASWVSGSCGQSFDQTNYIWIGIHMESDTSFYSYDSSGGVQTRYFNHTEFGNLPQTWPTGSDTSEPSYAPVIYMTL